jgi:hypothetical protein
MDLKNIGYFQIIGLVYYKRLNRADTFNLGDFIGIKLQQAKSLFE